MAQERALFPNDPPQDGDQFTIGNTTYAWDPTPGIWRAFTTATSSSGGSGVDPNWIRSFAANNQVVSAGNSFSGTLFTAPADGNGTWGILNTGRNTTANIVNITTTDSNTWGYIAGDGIAEIEYLTSGGEFIRQGSGTGGVDPRQAWVYLAPGDSLVFGFRFDGPSYQYVELDAYGGASTTVNIGGGGGGLQLGTFAGQTLAAGTSGTLALDFSGPAWVWLSGGGGGGGARVDTILDEYARNGGAAGSGGFFLEDVSVLEGATYAVGALGAGASVMKATNDNAAGTAGGTSTLSWSGITFTCTGGAGGPGSSGDSAGNPPATAGTASISGTDAPTLIPQADLLSAAQDAWRNTVIDGGSGNITLAYVQVSFPTGTSGRGQTLMLDGSGNTSRTATGTNGGAGTLTIVYQPQ